MLTYSGANRVLNETRKSSGWKQCNGEFSSRIYLLTCCAMKRSLKFVGDRKINNDNNNAVVWFCSN